MDFFFFYITRGNYRRICDIWYSSNLVSTVAVQLHSNKHLIILPYFSFLRNSFFFSVRLVSQVGLVFIRYVHTLNIFIVYGLIGISGMFTYTHE